MCLATRELAVCVQFWQAHLPPCQQLQDHQAHGMNVSAVGYLYFAGQCKLRRQEHLQRERKSGTQHEGTLSPGNHIPDLPAGCSSNTEHGDFQDGCDNRTHTDIVVCPLVRSADRRNAEYPRAYSSTHRARPRGNPQTGIRPRHLANGGNQRKNPATGRPQVATQVSQARMNTLHRRQSLSGATVATTESLSAPSHPLMASLSAATAAAHRASAHEGCITVQYTCNRFPAPYWTAVLFARSTTMERPRTDYVFSHQNVLNCLYCGARGNSGASWGVNADGISRRSLMGQ